MADEASSLLVEIRDLLQSQVKQADESLKLAGESVKISQRQVKTAIRLQKASLFGMGGLMVLVFAGFFLIAIEPRRRMLEIQDLTAQELRVRIETQKQIKERMDGARRPPKDAL